MTKLSVNINKIATLRNARGGNLPDLIKMALDIESFGAEGITVHPRPDERHIRYQDVRDLKPILSTEFNIEGYPSKEFISLVREIKPHQITLVPDPPGAITSNSGWDTIKYKTFLSEIISEMKTYSRVSVFVNPAEDMVFGAKEIGADRVELYTEAYARDYSKNKEEAIKEYVIAAKAAEKASLGLNAGHDLNLENLEYFKNMIPNLLEVSIGHALICDSLYYGIKNTVELYKRCLK
ncbi:MAG: pyridoxine 5'-phosphate synthase [Bacteroidales bacterium]|nr:pyridoxine 5'-phosphate synthase [Bacteroidales bacterium]MDD4545022.1 pyridoxine 5'-phosphate synthase [Bacteroidales bacterium]